MDDDLSLPGSHDRRTYRHFLNLDSISRSLVVFADLLIEVEIFFALNWRETRVLDGFDAVEPLDTPRTDVAVARG